MTSVVGLRDGLLSSLEVCRRSGLTYRRLHGLVDRGIVKAVLGGGTGVPFAFEPDVIDKLRVASALEASMPGEQAHQGWNQIVADVMDGPDPVPGWVVWSHGLGVRYVDATHLAATMTNGGLVALYAPLDFHPVE